MALTFDDIAEQLDTANTVDILTRRANGETKRTEIWSVAAAGQPYVRSAFGPNSWWYKRAIARAAAQFAVGDQSLPVRIERVSDAAEIARVDAAFSVKYAAEADDLKPILTDEARACTLRVVPA
jgi:hypothetical protein